MRWFRGPSDWLRARILMDYHTRSGTGVGTVRWEALGGQMPIPKDTGRIFLAGLLYGRSIASYTLSKQIKTEFFDRFDAAAVRLREGEPFSIDNWTFNAGGQDFDLVFQIDDTVERWGKPKVYVATLRAGRSKAELSIDLKRGWGLEKVLGPGSVVLLFAALCPELSDDDRRALGTLVTAMNRHYGGPEGIGGPGSETRALAAAVSFIGAVGSLIGAEEDTDHP